MTAPQRHSSFMFVLFGSRLANLRYSQNRTKDKVSCVAMLKPQDVLILLKIHNCRSKDWTFDELAQNLDIDTLEIQDALKRCSDSGLYFEQERRVIKHALLEFLVHGLKYVFPCKPGPLVQGLPTAHSAEPLKNLLFANQSDIYVWPDSEGPAKGRAIEPLYRSVPSAAKKDPELYSLLSLVDAIRVGRARERLLARVELEQRLMPGLMSASSNGTQSQSLLPSPSSTPPIKSASVRKRASRVGSSRKSIAKIKNLFVRASNTPISF